MNQNVEVQAVDVIKARARELNLTQASIAAELKISLPTIKRWWKGSGVGVSELSALASIVGISLAQLFLEIEGATLTYTYTAEQEQLLALNPKTLAFFDLLVSGKSSKTIQRQFAIADDELFRILSKLDKVALIELHEGNRAKLVRKGEPQWIPGGQLAAKYRRPMIQSFLGEHPKATTTFFIHNYLPEDLALLRGKIRELENLMMSCNVRGNMQNDLSESYGVYLSLRAFEWDLRDQLKS